LVFLLLAFRIKSDQPDKQFFYEKYFIQINLNIKPKFSVISKNVGKNLPFYFSYMPNTRFLMLKALAVP